MTQVAYSSNTFETQTPSNEEQLSYLIKELTTQYLEQYHQHQTPKNIHRRIIDEIEGSLFASTMKFTFGNQSKAAQYLGINRATLRTKLKRHELM
jgi:Fis family transcriptional regulator